MTDFTVLLKLTGRILGAGMAKSLKSMEREKPATEIEHNYNDKGYSISKYWSCAANNDVSSRPRLAYMLNDQSCHTTTILANGHASMASVQS